MKKKKLRKLVREAMDRAARAHDRSIVARKEGHAAGFALGQQEGQQEGQFRVAHVQDCVRKYALQVFGSREAAEADEKMYALLRILGENES